jgi:hypothetical protein
MNNNECFNHDITITSIHDYNYVYYVSTCMHNDHHDHELTINQTYFPLDSNIYSIFFYKAKLNSSLKYGKSGLNTCEQH